MVEQGIPVLHHSVEFLRFVFFESFGLLRNLLVLLFVALWFILRGDLLYVFPCFILFLCFSVLLVLRLPRLGKRELILVLFVRLFGLCLFRFVGFPETLVRERNQPCKQNCCLEES